MARRYNTNQIQSPAAPAGAVGEVPTWLSAWSAQSGGNLLRTMPLTVNVSALALGERVIIPAQMLSIVRAPGDNTLIAGARITNGGNGYTSAPNVAFSGGGGSGAAGTAIIESGAVTGIIITNPGYGYTSVPNIAFSGGSGNGAAATALLAGIETERAAAQGLAGDTAVNWWLQLHTANPGNNGAANPVTGMARFQQAADNWTGA